MTALMWTSKEAYNKHKEFYKVSNNDNIKLNNLVEEYLIRNGLLSSDIKKIKKDIYIKGCTYYKKYGIVIPDLTLD